MALYLRLNFVGTILGEDVGWCGHLLFLPSMSNKLTLN